MKTELIESDGSKFAKARVTARDQHVSLVVLCDSSLWQNRQNDEYRGKNEQKTQEPRQRKINKKEIHLRSYYDT